MRHISKKRILVVMLIIVGLAVTLFLGTRHVLAPDEPENFTPIIDSKATKTPTQFDKSLYSLTSPDSLWVIVNKNRPISLAYKPTDLTTPSIQLNPAKSAEENTLRKEASLQVEKMFNEAKKVGLDLMLASGYRSAELQASYYNNYVARDGQAAADRYSARPGTSEHQTGWALDIARVDRNCYLEICFADTAEGKWLAANAYKYGLILRYQNEAEKVTGYQYEPWHFRYVGAKLSGEIQKTGQTLEKFFEL